MVWCGQKENGITFVAILNNYDKSGKNMIFFGFITTSEKALSSVEEIPFSIVGLIILLLSIIAF